MATWKSSSWFESYPKNLRNSSNLIGVPLASAVFNLLSSTSPFSPTHLPPKKFTDSRGLGSQNRRFFCIRGLRHIVMASEGRLKNKTEEDHNPCRHVKKFCNSY